ncbi:MAG TPA: HlyC/CorC family transporter [Clostridiales bacterium]|nr:HlyC/CorC family transporter [Clostridiales bacterium]
MTVLSHISQPKRVFYFSYQGRVYKLDSDSIWRLIILVILVGLSAFFTAVETAFLSLSKIRLQNMADENVKNADKALKLLENQDKLKNAILVADNSVNVGAAVLATELAIRYFEDKGAAVAVIGMTFIVLIFGEIFPNLLAETYSENFSLRVSRIITVLIKILNPVIIFLIFLTNLIIRLFGLKINKKPRITEEELRTMVDVGHMEGVLDPEEKKMIHNVFQFGDSQVKDVMIPRTDIVAIDVESTYDKILEVFKKEQYSRMPVYRNTIDNIIGILHVKDIFFFDDKKEKFDIEKNIRKPYYTYENKRIAELFEDMRKKRLQMIVVADEYGGTAGIITMQDIVEEIFGDIGDEYEDIMDEIQQIAPGEYIIDGLTRLSTLNEELGTDLESEHYETIGGFITGIIGRFPKKGEVVVYNNLKWVVIDVYRTRVKRLRLKIEDPVQFNEEFADRKE